MFTERHRRHADEACNLSGRFTRCFGRWILLPTKCRWFMRSKRSHGERGLVPRPRRGTGCSELEIPPTLDGAAPGHTILLNLVYCPCRTRSSRATCSLKLPSDPRDQCCTCTGKQLLLERALAGGGLLTPPGPLLPTLVCQGRRQVLSLWQHPPPDDVLTFYDHVERSSKVDPARSALSSSVYCLRVPRFISA